jgi:hypothetical protein
MFFFGPETTVSILGERNLLRVYSITFFTNLIYTAIRYTVANGDVSPFVGHNAILRWTALQEVSYQDEDGYDKFWSESHVSEDFDMALRLQVAGYIIRLGSYTGDGFKEGVSLTVYDELSRWEKYAYGCNELLFHPFRFWIIRGPFTPLFRKFVTSNIRITSKITILAYIGTYYAIGAAWILTLLNYFLIGWFNGYLDHYYLDSFRVYFSLVIVFSALGNTALAILRYRLSEKSLLGSSKSPFQPQTQSKADLTSSIRKLQMASPHERLPWRNIPPRLSSPPMPLLRNRYVLGSYFEGGWEHLFL